MELSAVQAVEDARAPDAKITGAEADSSAQPNNNEPTDAAHESALPA